MNIKKDDQVKIMGGKDRGKTGKVLHVLVSEGRVTVEGLNLYKKRVKPKQQGQKGETVLVPRPLPASRVMIVCRSCKRPVRVGFRFEGEAKIRYCKKCQSPT